MDFLGLLSPTGLRVDGRRPPEVRQMSIEMGTVQSACGSATISQMGTTVEAAIQGPTARTKRPQWSETGAAINVSVTIHPGATIGPFRAAKHLESELETEITGILRRLCHLQSQKWSEIFVFVRVLEDSGSLLSVILNTISLALTQAAIPTKGLLIATTLVRIPNQPLVTELDRLTGALVDPLQIEWNRRPEITLAIIAHTKEIVFLRLRGTMPVPELQGEHGMIPLGMQICGEIQLRLRAALSSALF